ncbi:MAG: hypothetical protein IKR19_08935 [Acholeplasmatales bacterium]|nr:hypothetical protein [Acholeplasmatales bacterium]
MSDNNVYIQFANWYYYRLSDMANHNVYPSRDQMYFDIECRTIFESAKSIKEKYKAASQSIKAHYKWDDNEFKNYYNACSKIWNPDIAFSDWILKIKEFIEFIRYSEKCFMYRNESSIDRDNRSYILYVEDKENTLYIRDFEKDTKICVGFTESMVNDIIIDTTNSLAEYVESGKSPKKQITIEFIDVTIVREFGKQQVNQFRFMVSENPKYNDDTDKVLMDVIRNLISKYAKLTFDDIFDNYINNISGFKKSFILGELINGEVLFGEQ